MGPFDPISLEEEEQRLLDGDFVPALVDQVEPLRSAIEDDAEVGADRADEAWSAR